MFLDWFWITMILGWFLYFKIALRVLSSILLKKINAQEKLEKKLLKTSDISNLVLKKLPLWDKFILSLAITISESDGFTVSKKFVVYFLLFIQVRIVMFGGFSEKRDTVVSLLCIEDIVFACSVSKKIITQSRPIHDWAFWKILCYKWNFITLAIFFF